MGKVVNLYKEPYDVYIGRPGKGQTGYFGNPIAVGKPCPLCNQTHNLSDTLICYERYLRNRIETDERFRLAVKSLQDKTLGCFCKPKPCHGDILLKMAGELNDHP